MKRFWFVLAIGLLLIPKIGQAQQKPNSLIGERVFFVENPLAKKYGYLEYSFSRADAEKTMGGCKYNDLVGKSATVKAVESVGFLGWVVTLQMDSTNKTIYHLASSQLEWLPDVGFQSELKLAKSWVGRSFYNKVNGPKALGSKYNSVYKWHSLSEYLREVQRFVDDKGPSPSTDEAEKAHLERFQRVDLVDVPGWSDDGRPIFVFRLADSTRVYWLGKASAINDPGIDDFPYFQFERCWWKSDPLQGHPDWSEEFKKAIREGSLKIGMTDEMAKISWGDPLKINRTVTAGGVREQWIYGEFKPYVYFEDGKITGWDE